MQHTSMSAALHTPLLIPSIETSQFSSAYPRSLRLSLKIDPAIFGASAADHTAVNEPRDRLMGKQKVIQPLIFGCSHGNRPHSTGYNLITFNL
ncbi:uncharacterized protein V6R79_025712 [Siganus canaliculatus]